MKIAGAILCFNRPEYLHRVLLSLENSRDAPYIEWHVFQDGPQNKISNREYASIQELEAVKNVVNNSKLNITNYTRNKWNESIAQQKHRTHQLFDHYDLVFFFEDDLVVSPYYLRLLKIMANHFPNCIGMMNRHTNRTKKKEFVRECRLPRLWGYYMWKDTYKLIEEEYNEYYEQINKLDYNIKWQYPNLRKQFDFTYPTVMHDKSLTRMLKNQGIKKLWPDVSRGTYIGKEGAIAYRTEKTWRKKGMHEQPKRITYDSDRDLKGFILK